MLEELDQIDWKSLQAEEIPQWIRQFVSSDLKVRSDAHGYIEDGILRANLNFEDVDRGYGISQILKTDVPYLIVPFLIELLNYEEVEWKSSILTMLVFMATYVDFHFEGDVYVDRARQIRQAIWNKRDVYLRLLHHHDAEIRCAIVQLLTTYHEYTQETIPAIFQRIKAEEQAATIAQMLWSINDDLIRKSRFPEQYLAEFSALLTELLSPENKHVLRITAAVSLIDLLHSEAPQEAIDYVVDTMIYETDPQQLGYYLPPVYSNWQGKALLRLGPEKGIVATTVIIKYTRHWENGVHAMMAALILAFTPDQFPQHYGWFRAQGAGVPAYDARFVVDDKYKPQVDLEQLNDAQRKVINALVDTAWVWKLKTNMFEIFGLPDNREALQKLIL